MAVKVFLEEWWVPAPHQVPQLRFPSSGSSVEKRRPYNFWLQKPVGIVVE